MLLSQNDSLLLVVDTQAGLMPKIIDTDRITAVTKRLVSVARELAVPILITEHYPEGLKPTIPEIALHLAEDYKPLLKRIFSCYGSKDFREALETTGRQSIVMVGIETHICILQTALQCKEAGYHVHVVADGVGSRSALDHDIALDRMARAGTILLTWEMVAYEWMRRADTEAFKRVLPHIKKGLDRD
jgi:nicotinamidase-related amidase